jgi:hypothetical protein
MSWTEKDLNNLKSKGLVDDSKLLSVLPALKK